jgi:hypothetical protein
MKQILVLLVLLGAGFGLFKRLSPPPQAPDLTFESLSGAEVGWAELREGKRYLLAVFLLPNCGLSDFSAELVSGLHGRYQGTVAFVGLAFGNASVADRYRQDHGLGFEVVGLRAVTDPYAAQEFFDAVRGAYGSSSGVYGGTVILLNAENQMMFGLSQGDVRELPERLAEL